MSNFPTNLKYTKTHEWVKEDEQGNYAVGITDHAQSLLGEIVYIELPEPGTELNHSDECGVIESVKAASDLYFPLSGEIIEVNAALFDSPDLVNSDPYGEGWLFRIEIRDESELSTLLGAEHYKKHVVSEAH